MRTSRIGVVFAALLTAARLSAADDPRLLFERGRTLLQSGRAAEASPLLERAVALAPAHAEFHYALAKSYAAEAKQSVNVARLLVLGWNIGDELETAVRLDPADVDARLDLVRYYVTAPRLVGGSMNKARLQASLLAKRNRALGAFARGYIAYKGEQAFAPARKEFETAIRLAENAPAKVLAMTWLGYLSQESRQYDRAFDLWNELVALDPAQTAALYEIGRTSVFCYCRYDDGQQALGRYLATTPKPDDPTLAMAHLQLGLLHEHRGDRDAARREIDLALSLDPAVDGGAAAKKRLAK